MNVFLIIISALCESFYNIYLTKSKGFADWQVNLITITFLITGILTFKKAIMVMPLSIAIVMWSGFSLIATIILDVYFFKTRLDFKIMVCMALCIICIIGLQYFNSQKQAIK